jgi:small subunit ribosomal protein S13
MARIIGIDVPDKKRLEVALTYIYGIGRKLSNQIIAKLGLDPNMRAHQLSQDDVARMFSNLTTSWKET